MTHYQKTTRNISVSVKPYFLEEHSEPNEDQYFWAYHVKIANQSNETVQLLKRFWQITDAKGHRIEVRGVGVVGEQPFIHPGQVYEYTSAAPLPTPSGMMVGAYQLANHDGEHFDVDIPAFSLDSPHERAPLN
ncbi:MAG: Co2+/Mg2+ efflux protein ApaG [Candidatus Symbiobacter sp.]|nr:Co2+/Mg2+ efflux protein ApaG [Candidatus Symbiobacter sp.]